MNDIELLSSYARTHDQNSFADLVRRQVDFVFSAALRQVYGDAHLAADVTQQVFIALARNPGSAARHSSLEGWLYTTARHTAANAIRQQRRRRARELQAHAMNSTTNDPSCDEMWAQVRPVLDAAMSDLSAADRESILLRYFVGRPFAAIAQQLDINENTARMRVERALERLRASLDRRGVRSTASALGAAIAGHAVLAAPASLAPAISAAAPLVAGTAGASAIGAWLLHGGLAAAITLTGILVHRSQAATEREYESELRELRRDAPAARAAAGPAPQSASPAEAAQLALLEDQLLEAAAELETLARVPAQRRLPPPPPIEEPKDRPPVLRVPANPVYPPHLHEAGIAGKVMLEFVVDTNGRVVAAKALSSTHPDFEAPAVEAINQWEFYPGWSSERFVNTRVTQVINFTPPTATRDSALAPTPK